MGQEEDGKNLGSWLCHQSTESPKIGANPPPCTSHLGTLKPVFEPLTVLSPCVSYLGSWFPVTCSWKHSPWYTHVKRNHVTLRDREGRGLGEFGSLEDLSLESFSYCLAAFWPFCWPVYFFCRRRVRKFYIKYLVTPVKWSGKTAEMSVAFTRCEGLDVGLCHPLPHSMHTGAYYSLLLPQIADFLMCLPVARF